MARVWTEKNRPPDDVDSLFFRELGNGNVLLDRSRSSPHPRPRLPVGGVGGRSPSIDVSPGSRLGRVGSHRKICVTPAATSCTSSETDGLEGPSHPSHQSVEEP